MLYAYASVMLSVTSIALFTSTVQQHLSHLCDHTMYVSWVSVDLFPHIIQISSLHKTITFLMYRKLHVVITSIIRKFIICSEQTSSSSLMIASGMVCFKVNISFTDDFWEVLEIFVRKHQQKPIIEFARVRAGKCLVLIQNTAGQMKFKGKNHSFHPPTCCQLLFHNVNLNVYVFIFKKQKQKNNELLTPDIYC